MRVLKMFGLALILAGAVSCRTIPSAVMHAHSEATKQSIEALTIAEDLLQKIEAKSEELNTAFVSTQFTEWREHFRVMSDNRNVVKRFLQSTNGDEELVGAYAVGYKLMIDMNGGMNQINNDWRLMILEENSVTEFIRLFRKDIGRFRELDRKFNDWITQFKVKN